jgi:hypothetical protein
MQTRITEPYSAFTLQTNDWSRHKNKNKKRIPGHEATPLMVDVPFTSQPVCYYTWPCRLRSKGPLDSESSGPILVKQTQIRNPTYKSLSRLFWHQPFRKAKAGLHSLASQARQQGNKGISVQTMQDPIQFFHCRSIGDQPPPRSITWGRNWILQLQFLPNSSQAYDKHGRNLDLGDPSGSPAPDREQIRTRKPHLQTQYYLSSCLEHLTGQGKQQTRSLTTVQSQHPPSACQGRYM